jgi:adenosine deaminase
LLREPEDFALIVTNLGDELARHAVRYAEVTFTPYTHTHLLQKGLTIADLLAGLDAGRRRVLDRHGIHLNWIFDIPRNVSFHSNGGYDPAPADTTLAYALEGMPQGVIGFGLGGNEVGAPAAPFAHAFAAAKAAGLHSVPHAGETVGPVSVWNALHALGAERIGHGIRTIEDPHLLAYLKHHQIPLEVNLTSNICLHVYRSLAQHPLPHLDRMGLHVTVNSDDPPLFNTDLSREYAILADIFGYSLADIVRLAHNAIQASFAPPPLRTAIATELEQWFANQLTITDPAR